MAHEKQIKRKDVPSAVMSSFTSTYPEAVIKGFSKETEGGRTLYEVESINGKMSLDVLCTLDGSVVEVEEGIDKGKLPGAVKSVVALKASNDDITRVERKTVGSHVTYEIGIARGKRVVELVVDEKGDIINGKDVGNEEGSSKPK